MKFNKLIIIFIVLLGIFTIGSVCAFENSTDDSISQIDEVSSCDNTVLANESENIEEIASDINITFDHQMWEENLTDINVELPENAEGTFILNINNLNIYNQTITDKTISIPVKLPEPLFPYIIENIYPPRDCTNYKVTAFYNDIELNITQPVLSVMKYPPQYNYLWGISSEILQYDTSIWSMIMFPRSANGISEIYIDNKLVNKTKVIGPYLHYNADEVAGLDLGNHTMKIVYYGDSYYHDANKTIQFEVVNVKISIPTVIYIGHDDCISVNVLKNTTGKVKVYIDDALVHTGSTDKYGEFILSLEEYLKYNSSQIKIEFMGSEFSRQKTVPASVKYDFGYYDGGSIFVYGEDNIIELILPDFLNNKLLSVNINSTKYNFTHPSYYMNNIVEIDISKLDAGNYTITISYPGDDRYCSRTESYNFTVVYAPVYPYYIEFEDKSSVKINLPSDAKGNLNLYIDGVFYKAVKLINGTSSIKISDLNPGEYILNATYDGDDYVISNMTGMIRVNPKFTVDYFFTAGQDKKITIKVPENCKGHVIFYIDSKEYDVPIKNGIAQYSFKNLKAGEHIVYAEYYGANGFKTEDENIITIYKPKIKIISSKIYTNNVYAKIKVLDNKGKAIKNAQVTFKINKKIIKAKTNSKGIATVKSNLKLQAKKYTITAEYNGGKASKRVTAKHVVSLKSATIKKSAKKLVLKATLKQSQKAIKSKTVTFKFNGKVIKAKTNSKGVAKVTIKSKILKKLKVGKTVTYQASYLKDTVKKIGKVKR